MLIFWISTFILSKDLFGRNYGDATRDEYMVRSSVLRMNPVSCLGLLEGVSCFTLLGYRP